jgi:aspartate carbamoyltransferase catalytic subunit
MGEMEVTMGLIVVGEKVPKKEKAARKEQEQKKEKVKRTVSDWVAAPFKKDIKIYPNPVVRGNDIKANVSLKQVGSYQLELIDVQGRVMEVQKLVMVTKEQQVTISTQTDWGAGIYWVRITAPGVKNVYQAKLLLQ